MRRASSATPVFACQATDSRGAGQFARNTAISFDTDARHRRVAYSRHEVLRRLPLLISGCGYPGTIDRPSTRQVERRRAGKVSEPE